MATVLVVDDRPVNRDLMRTVLEHGGHRVLEAGDGLEALNMIADEVPDVVLTDVVMPRMDGYQFVRELRAKAETAGLPVIFWTANYLEEEVAPLAHAYGVRHVVTKTDDPHKLLEAIDAELSSERTAEAPLIDEHVTREHLRTVNAKMVEKIRQMQDNELALRRSEQRFRLMAEAAPVGIVLVDAAGRAVYVNLRLAAILGRSSAQLAGFAWLEAVGLAGDPALTELLSGERSELARHRWPFERPDGAGWVDISLHNTYDDRGQVLQCVGVIEDITEKVAAEERQREMDQRLRVAERLESIGQLASGVAHDFNNILTAVLGYAQVARELVEAGAETDGVESDLAASLTKCLDGLTTAGNRAAHLTSRLLAFGRPDIATPESLDLNSFLDEVETLLEPTLGAAVQIVHDRVVDLWPVYADSSQLSQVVLNLAVNSRDAMPEGGRLVLRTRNHVVEPDAEADRTGLAPGRYVRLTVVDSGHGMPAEVIERAMNPFFTTKPVGKGTGLGLATVYSIVRKYGGRLIIQSVVGEGTTVDVYLPVADAKAGRPAPQSTVDDEPTGIETVLVVDDESSIRDIAATMLTSAGYRVLTATSGAEALAIAGRGEPVDLLLTDVVMPTISGGELAKRFLAVSPRTKVLYMSGYPEALRTAHQSLSESAPLTKPFTSKTLRQATRAALRERQQDVSMSGSADMPQ
ncbi:response regulator [Actinophytocola sp.]|uniref:hybrid sensor histidine kinase/response regulator n=1 Tax=Actinophytocola sp. TaxID=1872138 RepID=UPI002ED472EC